MARVQTLLIGNKAYSSWSARPWLLMTALGIAFEEKIIPLYAEGSREKALAVAPTGKVPVLLADGFPVWDSLAIVEFLHERFPDKNVWPADAQKRARARSLCAEMHSGFQALRQACPTNFRRDAREESLELDETARENLARIDAIFSQAQGPFMFGAYSAADACFTPVATRLHIYRLPVSARAQAYAQSLLAHPAYTKWREGARAEDWVIDRWENL